MGPITLENAQAAQGMLLKDWQSATVVGLVVALAVVFLWFVRTSALRVRDRDRIQDKQDAYAREVAKHIHENTEALITLTRAVDDLRHRARRPSPEPKPGDK